MSDTKLWPDESVRKLAAKDGGGGFLGGRGMEFLLMGSLAVVIVGSLALTIYYGLGGNSSPGSDVKPMFKCMMAECGYEFEATADQRPGPGIMPDGRGLIPRLDCPKCGEKECCATMFRCPNCEKYYVSARADYNERLMRGEVAVDEQPPADICSYCQTDRIEWYRANRKKRQ